MQISDADLAKIRLKCLELGISNDVHATLAKASRYAAWVMRERTARSERTAPGPEVAPPALPERLAAFKLGKVAAIIESGKPGTLDRIKSTLGLAKKNK